MAVGDGTMLRGTAARMCPWELCLPWPLPVFLFSLPVLLEKLKTPKSHQWSSLTHTPSNNIRKSLRALWIQAPKFPVHQEVTQSHVPATVMSCPSTQSQATMSEPSEAMNSNNNYFPWVVFVRYSSRSDKKEHTTHTLFLISYTHPQGNTFP